MVPDFMQQVPFSQIDRTQPLPLRDPIPESGTVTIGGAFGDEQFQVAQSQQVDIRIDDVDDFVSIHEESEIHGGLGLSSDDDL